MDFSFFSRVRQGIRSPCQAVKQLLRHWTMPDNDAPVLNTALDLTLSRTESVLENALLRQQLIVLKWHTKRPALSWRDRALFVLLASKLRTWKQSLLIVQPDTVLRWHRELFRRIWRRKSRSERKLPGRPRLSNEVIALINRMARENHIWGAKRIRGELKKLGIEVATSTIQRYLRDIRGPLASKQTWATFLCNHASKIWACDFVQTYDAFFRAVFVFVIIGLGSRRVVHFAVTRSPTDAWVAQQLRNGTPFGEGPRYLIRNNDSTYGPSFARVAAGIEVLRTPCRAPRANTICERFLGSLRRECLDHILILGEGHLRRTLKEYARYFNHARPHQGIEQAIPCPPEWLAHTGRVVALPVLGGLHHGYRRQVA